MRTWIVTILLILALEGVSKCYLVLTSHYPRERAKWEDVVILAAVVGLLLWGVVALRTG